MLNVLLVDGNQDRQLALSCALWSHGCQLQAVSTVHCGTRALAEGSYQLILIDENLGPTFVEWVYEQQPRALVTLTDQPLLPPVPWRRLEKSSFLSELPKILDQLEPPQRFGSR